MEILNSVESGQAYSNIAINAYIARNRPDSHSLVREIVYGVLKNKLCLDYFIERLTDRPAARIKPAVVNILRMGLYQLIYLDSVPEYAAVNESVRLAERFAHGQTGFVNAVLRAWIRKADTIKFPDKEKDPITYYSTRYSYPAWIVRLFLEQYDVDFAEELMKAGNETPNLCIRANSTKTDRQSLIESLEEAGFKAEKGKHAKFSIYVKGSGLLDSSLFSQGFFSVQDESSMLAVETLDPQPGETVMDVCAAPGGKTVYIGELMENKGRIVAFDIFEHKLALIRDAAGRNGITVIETSIWDGTAVNGEYVEKADRVLVDAPCSGLGVVRRKPEIKYAGNESLPEIMARTQLGILRSAAEYVKAGGILVYTTCTVTRQENDDTVNDFLEGDERFVMISKRQLFPNVDGTDGFFICEMRKKK